MAIGSTQVSVSSLSKNGSLYGNTQGTVTFYYEDEAGIELSETAAFQTTIQSPFSEEAARQEDDTTQWWIIMAVILGVLILFAMIVIARRRQFESVELKRKVRLRRKDEMVEKVLETQKTE